jgi:hypothetical protein
MSSWKPINKPIVEHPIPPLRPPPSAPKIRTPLPSSPIRRTPRHKQQPEGSERLVPIENLLSQSPAFPDNHFLSSFAKNTNRYGRPGLTVSQVEKAKSQIIAQRSGAQIPESNPSQNSTPSAQPPQRVESSNIVSVPRENGQTWYPYQPWLCTVEQTQQETTHSGPPASTTSRVQEGNPPTAVSRPNPQIVGPTPSQHLAPNVQSSVPEANSATHACKKLSPPIYRPSTRAQFDRDLIWRLEYSQIFEYSSHYRKHPPLGRLEPINRSWLLRDPRFSYLETSYHETERLLRPLEGSTTRISRFESQFPRERITVEQLTNPTLDTAILAWAYQK